MTNKELTRQEQLDAIYDILQVNLEILGALSKRVEELELKVEQRTSIMDVRFGLHD